jgi:LysM repeat protein
MRCVRTSLYAVLGLAAAALLAACGGGGGSEPGQVAGSGQVTDPATVPSVAPISGELTYLIRDNGVSAPGGASTAVSGGGTPVTSNRGTYEIKPGDFCFTIAEQLGVTVDELLKLNPGTDCENLRVGAQLRIPAGAAATTTPTPAPSSTRVRGTGTPTPTTTGKGQYTIQAGDLCVDIAASYGVSVDALVAANNIDCDNLVVGQKITIP